MIIENKLISEKYALMSRSQWPSSLRLELSSLARTQESWGRIPHKANIFSMCVCLFCVCVVLCLGRGLATG
jgi:hypothetical protein